MSFIIYTPGYLIAPRILNNPHLTKGARKTPIQRLDVSGFGDTQTYVHGVGVGHGPTVLAMLDYFFSMYGGREVKFPTLPSNNAIGLIHVGHTQDGVHTSNLYLFETSPHLQPLSIEETFAVGVYPESLEDELASAQQSDADTPNKFVDLMVKTLNLQRSDICAVLVEEIE